MGKLDSSSNADFSGQGKKIVKLNSHNHTTPGAYFLKVASYKNENIFGEVDANFVLLNPLGTIVQREWKKAVNERRDIIVDEFRVLPNCICAIIWIAEFQNRELWPFIPLPPLRPAPFGGQIKPKIVTSFVAQVKKTVADEWHKFYHDPGFRIWQDDYEIVMITGEADYRKMKNKFRENMVME